MRSSNAIARLVVDANPILSAVLGGSAKRVFLSFKIEEFAVAIPTLREVEAYLPVLARKPRVAQAGITEDLLRAALAALPLTLYPRRFYRAFLREAEKLIGARDPKDVDVLALALKLRAPIWTNDADFQGLNVEVFPTAVLIQKLGDA